MMHDAGPESRRSNRKRILKGGVIAFSGRHATLPCVLRDMSTMGARLAVQNASLVPDTFELIVELDGLEAPCRVVWRKAKEVGVSFVAEPVKTAPKRAQIVSPSDRAGATASLRRPLAPRTPTQGVPAVARVPNASAPAPETLVIAADDITTEAQPAATACASEAPVAAAAAQAAPIAVASTPSAGAQRPAIPIVIADDDPDDRLLLGDAFRESAFSHPISFVENGEELLQYLRGQGPHAGRAMPGLILLDLNMPKMDGRTALMHLKADTALRRIPVIVLTTSNAEDDIQRTYDLGVSAYVPKPNSFDGLLDLVQSLNNYWMRFVASPVSTATH